MRSKVTKSGVCSRCPPKSGTEHGTRRKLYCTVLERNVSKWVWLNCGHKPSTVLVLKLPCQEKQKSYWVGKTICLIPVALPQLPPKTKKENFPEWLCKNQNNTENIYINIYYLLLLKGFLLWNIAKKWQDVIRRVFQWKIRTFQVRAKFPEHLEHGCIAAYLRVMTA